VVSNVKELPPCEILIKADGKWYHKGVEIIRKDIINFFYEHLDLDEEGRYIISWRNEKCVVDVEDTAFFVQRVDKTKSGFLLYLSDGTQEELDPETLYVGKENVLYCRVKKGKFPAKFLRPAYYQIADYIEEEKGKYFITVNGKRYFIKND
jgi:hypothetical protein